MLFLVLLSSIFLSVIFPNQTTNIDIQKPKIAEKIITDTYFGYHTLRAVVSRSIIEMVYARVS